jgi:hypothetical protein
MGDATEPVRTRFEPNLFGAITARGGQPLSFNLTQNDKMSANIITDGQKQYPPCTVSIMSRPLWAYSRIASVLYLFPSSWVSTCTCILRCLLTLSCHFISTTFFKWAVRLQLDASSSAIPSRCWAHRLGTPRWAQTIYWESPWRGN